MPRKLFAALLATTIGLSGCSYFQFPGVHKVEIQQGNIITQEMVAQLQPGQTKSQVRYIMGTPLIADTFNQDRWDYFFSRQKGSDEEQKNITIFFINDKLSKVVESDPQSDSDS